MGQPVLDDITVIDFSQAIAAPYATALLGDLGADVISIEPPGGGSQRHFIQGIAHDNVSRNKRSLVLDIRSDGADEIMHRLIREADVFLHNYRPGTSFVESMGYDYESVRALNEDIIYCSVTGFGDDGPYSTRPGFDPLAQAMSGLMWVTGEPDRKPSRVGTSVIDFSTGVYAAFAIVSAIRHRDRTGEGQKIEASLFDTAAAFMSQWYTYYTRTGEQIQRQGHSWEAYAPVGVFDTVDEPVYIAIPLQSIWEAFCEALDAPKWVADPRFETNELRIDHREELQELIETEFARYSRDELIDLLLEAGVPVSELQTIAEAAKDEHLHERETVKSVENPERGDEVLITDIPVKFSEIQTVTRRAPGQGEHTKAVLADLGFSDEEIADLVDRDTVS